MGLRPEVRFRVERLAGTGEEPQAREVVLLRRGFAVAHPHAQRRRRGEHQVDAEALDQLPGHFRRGIVGHAFAAEDGRAHRERAVDDERVADDPADIRRAPVDVALADLVEGARQVGDADHVAAGGMHDTFRLAGGSRGIEDEQRVLGVHRLGVAVDLARLLDVVEVDLADALEGVGRVARPRAAAVDDDVLDESEVAHGLVHRRLERDLLAAPESVVGGDDDLGARVDDARAQRLRPHAGENHRVDGADARASEHGDDALGDERHVDDHPVALDHPEPPQRVGEAVHFAIEAVVGVGDLFAVLADPDQGGLVAPVGVNVAVDAVGGDVEFPAEEPLVVRQLEAAHGVERLDPVDELGALRPEDLGSSAAAARSMSSLTR
jgi:hypothetical protein